MGGAFFIFLIVQFIRGIPRELDESAKSTVLVRHLSAHHHAADPAALITVTIFSFIWGWDEYFGPLIYLNTVDKYTVPSRSGCSSTPSRPFRGRCLPYPCSPCSRR